MDALALLHVCVIEGTRVEVSQSPFEGYRDDSRFSVLKIHRIALVPSKRFFFYLFSLSVGNFAS